MSRGFMRVKIKSIEYGPLPTRDILKCLPLADGSVEQIRCWHILEHLPQRHLTEDIDALLFVINEFQRVLEYDGEAHITVPWIEHESAHLPNHYRFFNYDVFNYFNWRPKKGDQKGEGLAGKWKVARNEIIDERDIEVILRKVK